MSTNTTFIVRSVNFYTTYNDVDDAEHIDIDNCSDATVSSNDESEYEILNTDSSDSDYDFDECESEQNELECMEFIFFGFTTALEILSGFWFTKGKPKVNQRYHTKGTALCVNLFCESGNNSYWPSQPKVKYTFMGNILTVASIIFGGGTYIQYNSVSNILKLQFSSSTQFYALQKKYVFPE